MKLDSYIFSIRSNFIVKRKYSTPDRDWYNYVQVVNKCMHVAAATFSFSM